MSETQPVHRAAAGSAQLVRDAVAEADRTRRVREASRQLWRIAPMVAGAALAVAAATRLAGWSAALPLIILGIGTAGLIAYGYAGRRHHAISDSAAAEIDSDAGLRGELRSASWFAGREGRDVWADLHLARAAARLDATDWAQLYPVRRAGRSRLATSIMVIATLALVVITFTGRPNVAGSVSLKSVAGPAPRGAAVLQTDMLPPELPSELEELLKAAEAGGLTPGANPASSAQMKDLLAQLAALHDPELLKALAQAMAAKSGNTNEQLAQKLKDLADRTRRASMSMTLPDAKKALEDLSKQLSDAAKSEKTDKGKNPDEGMPSDKSQQDDSGKSENGDDSADASMQFTKDAAAGSGIAVLMSSTEAPPSNDMTPGVGVGGASGARPGGGTMADIERALRHETVEASADSAGDNVITTGLRKKTEHGNATVTFTHGAAAASDRSRAAAPPRMPEARRTGVQTYFQRKQ